MLKNKTNTTSENEKKHTASQRRTNEETLYIEHWKKIHSNIQHWDMKLANGSENDEKNKYK